MGLTTEEVFARLALSGPNQVSRPQRRLHLFRELLWQPLVLLLVLVGAVYAVLGRFSDATVIMIVIVAVIGVEAAIRWRAGQALSTLSKLSAAHALVWRDGELREVEPEGLVRDDVILLSAGSRVPADAQLVQSSTFLVDESLVSGESQPVEHGLGFGLDANLHAGSHVVRGQGVAVITAIGKESALGRVAALVERSQPPPSPLQQQMGRLAKALIALSIASSLVVALIGFLHGLPGQEMLIDGLTLAFASIPAELPVLVAVVLGFGSLYLAKRGAVVRNLRAAETLGAMTLLCTDKTGTLTRNRIALTETITAARVMGVQNDPGDPEYVRKVARLACDPPAGDDPRSTDPIDLAIWRTSRPDWPEANVRFAFDEGRRLASGLSEIGGQMVLGVKGAAEAVLIRSVSWRSSQGIETLDEEQKSQALAMARELAASGGRVLAVASRGISGPLEGGPTWLEQE
ncbi:MAG: HAD-IC family P-type ATPase, partial [Candidatus Dormibacteraceae bacterium]